MRSRAKPDLVASMPDRELSAADFLDYVRVTPGGLSPLADLLAQTFLTIGKKVIPRLTSGFYSSVIIDGYGGVLPGHVFRVWAALAHTEVGIERIPVRVVRASRDLSKDAVMAAVKPFMPRAGPSPLIVTDYINTGVTIAKLIDSLNAVKTGSHVTVVAMAYTKDGVDQLRKMYGDHITVVHGDNNQAIRKLFLEKRFKHFQIPPGNRHLPVFDRQVRDWIEVNRTMRHLGRITWASLTDARNEASCINGFTSRASDLLRRFRASFSPSNPRLALYRELQAARRSPGVPPRRERITRGR